jgi:hypothetical protein
MRRKAPVVANKYDLAGYLVNLNTLITAQFESARSRPSVELADEYERGWAELKSLIKQEREDEARAVDKSSG